MEYVTYRQEKDREFLHSLSSFLDKHAFVDANIALVMSYEARLRSPL